MYLKLISFEKFVCYVIQNFALAEMSRSRCFIDVIFNSFSKINIGLLFYSINMYYLYLK